VVRSVRAVPGRHRSPGGSAASHRQKPHARRSRDRDRAPPGCRRRDARRIDLRPGPDCVCRGGVGDQTLAALRADGSRVVTAPLPLIGIGRPRQPDLPPVTLTIDGQSLSVPAGTTILGAAARLGITVPTLCYLETLRPMNVCRLCVVEVEGARVLAPSCSRVVEPGMVVHTRSPRVMLARKLVLELLGSSVDLSTAPRMTALLEVSGLRA